MRVEEITTGTITEPVTLDEAKAHLVVHTDLDDALITRQISEARAIAEQYIGRLIATHAFRYTLDCFPAAIEVPKLDLLAVTKLDYVDVDGATQSLDAADYTVRYCTTCTHVVPAYGTEWPKTEAGFDKVTLEWTAGYSNIPLDLIAAIKLILGELYLHREDSVDGVTTNAVTLTSKELMRPYRRITL